MTLSETNGVQQLPFGEGADEEMSGADLVKAVQRPGIGPRQQHQQGGLVGLHRFSDGSRRCLAFGQGASRIDDRDRGTGSDETGLDIVGAPGRDRLPSRGFRQSAELVAMTKGQDEKCGGHTRV